MSEKYIENLRCNFEEHLDHEVNRRIANIGERQSPDNTGSQLKVVLRFFGKYVDKSLLPVGTHKHNSLSNCLFIQLSVSK